MRPIRSEHEPREEILISRDTISRDRAVDGVLQKLKLATRRVQPFAELFSQAQATDRSNIDLPEEFQKVWLHLLMSLICFQQDATRTTDHMDVCTGLLVDGMRKVVQRPNQKPLVEYAVVMPFQLASLLNFQLLQDITRASLDIDTTYWEYLKSLVSRLKESPFPSS